MYRDKVRIITSLKIATDDFPDGHWFSLGDTVKEGGAITGFFSNKATWWRHDPLGMSIVGIEVDGEMYSIGCHMVSGIEWEDRNREQK